jgi:hypothetical protein
MRSSVERRPVIPGRVEGTSPESITAEFSEQTLMPILKRPVVMDSGFRALRGPGMMDQKYLSHT